MNLSRTFLGHISPPNQNCIKNKFNWNYSLNNKNNLYKKDRKTESTTRNCSDLFTKLLCITSAEISVDPDGLQHQTGADLGFCTANNSTSSQPHTTILFVLQITDRSQGLKHRWRKRGSEEERIYRFNFPERHKGDGAASVHCCLSIMGLMCFTEFTPLLQTAALLCSTNLSQREMDKGNFS